jgi:S-adenosylmethionine hydrolase
MTELPIGTAVQRGRTLEGSVIYVDGFGNLVTNIDRATLKAFVASFRVPRVSVTIARGASMEVFQAYGDVPPGAGLALVGSFGLLEIAVRDGSAASVLGLAQGASVSVVVST